MLIKRKLRGRARQVWAALLRRLRLRHNAPGASSVPAQRIPTYALILREERRAQDLLHVSAIQAVFIEKHDLLLWKYVQ